MKQWSWIALLLIYAVGIAYASHQPISVGDSAIPHIDKLFHLMEFGLFMFLSWQATGQRLWLAMIVTLAFAGSDEWHQSLVPARDASLLDFLADAVGASAMAALLRYKAVLWRFLRVRILGH
ncbi:MAG: VanZ family protein [Candidatus Atribacteria bacterium]|jgi:VanZ family protein|nr:MAG: VanZ family protein [Candidatus Atribacteria bacterium]